MSSKAGSCWFMMFCSVLMILCRDFLSAAELLPHHARMPCVRQQQNDTKSFFGRFIFLSVLRKYSCFCAFFCDFKFLLPFLKLLSTECSMQILIHCKYITIYKQYRTTPFKNNALNKETCLKTETDIMKIYICSAFCAFLTSAVVFVFYEKSSEMCVTKKLKLDTLSTFSQLICSGKCNHASS